MNVNGHVFLAIVPVAGPSVSQSFCHPKMASLNEWKCVYRTEFFKKFLLDAHDRVYKYLKWMANSSQWRLFKFYVLFYPPGRFRCLDMFTRMLANVETKPFELSSSGFVNNCNVIDVIEIKWKVLSFCWTVFCPSAHHKRWENKRIPACTSRQGRTILKRYRYEFSRSEDQETRMVPCSDRKVATTVVLPCL